MPDTYRAFPTPDPYTYGAVPTPDKYLYRAVPTPDTYLYRAVPTPDTHSYCIDFYRAYFMSVTEALSRKNMLSSTSKYTAPAMEWTTPSAGDRHSLNRGLDSIKQQLEEHKMEHDVSASVYNLHLSQQKKQSRLTYLDVDESDEDRWPEF